MEMNTTHSSDYRQLYRITDNLRGRCTDGISDTQDIYASQSTTTVHTLVAFFDELSPSLDRFPLCGDFPLSYRSGMGAYTGAACRRDHLVTVLLRPPPGHHPGKRQARHARVLQIGLRLTITQADARPVMPVSFR